MLQVWCAQINFVNDTLTKTYDQNYDIDAIVSTAVGGLNLDYATDEVGNIKTVLLTNVSFGLEYDKLYRLSHVRDQNAALIEGFTYDRTGNRLSKTLRDTPTLPYDYAASNHKLTNAGTGVRSFDANGNTTQIPGTGALAYDERNRLKTVVDTASARKARGERVSTGAAPSGGGIGESIAGAKSIGGGCIGNGSASVFIYSESGALLGNYNLCDATDEDVVYLDQCH